MRILIIIVLVLSLSACTALPNIIQSPDAAQSSAAQTAPTTADPFAQFFEQILNTDKVTVFKEYFSDIHADNASYFFVSAALAELNGDDVAEIVITLSNETVAANAQSVTQIYRLHEGQFEKFGLKLSGVPSFYKTGKLLLTSVHLLQNQALQQFSLVDIAEEVRVIESGEYQAYFATAAQDEREKFEALADYAKAALVGSTDENIHVIYRDNTILNLLMFNDRQYDYNKALAMTQRLADMRRVNLQPLNAEFLEALEHYKRDQLGAPVIQEKMARDLTDQYVRATQAKLSDPNFRRIRAGENEYVVESTGLGKSTTLFNIIAGTVDGREVYFQNNLPLYYRSNKLGYYADDKNLSAVFTQIKKQFDADIARYYLSEFFLTEAYSGTLSWPLYQTEYFH